MKRRDQRFKFPMKENEVTETWENIKRNLEKVAVKDLTELSFVQIYSGVVAMVDANAGDVVYNGTADVLKERLKQVRKEVDEFVDDPDFIDKLKDICLEYRKAVGIMRDILMYLDKSFIKQEKLDNVFEMAMKLFRTEVIQYEPVRIKINTILREMISTTRNRRQLDWEKVKNTLSMLLALSIDRKYYEEEFEKKFVDEFSGLYQRKAQEFLAFGTPAQYIKHAKEFMSDETELIQSCFDQASQYKIIEVLKSEIVAKHEEEVLKMDTGLEYMFMNLKYEEIREVYMFYKTVDDGITTMANEVSKYLRARGDDLFQQFSGVSGAQFLEQVIQLKEVLDRFLSESFDNDDIMRNQMQSDFDYFLTMEHTISGED